MDGFALLEPWVHWRFDLDFLLSRLALGLDLFGPYEPLLWAMLAFWVSAAILLWARISHEQRQSDRDYLAYVSRRLPTLGHLARERAREVTSASRLNDRL